ncbi:MAG: aminoacyl-tRNA hydrolase [Syntrophales bacterium]
MKIVIGLGNPGAVYRLTRHNLGFMVVDELSGIHGIPVNRKKFNALVGEGFIEGIAALLVKPLTFMNLSGISARDILSYYKGDIHDLIIVHDDLDLEPWVVRVKTGGGAGGHKGLLSIMEHLGSREFHRVRMGIGKPLMKEMVESYVLESFSKEDIPLVARQVERACEAVGMLVSSQIQKAMNKFNVRNSGHEGKTDRD